MGCEVDFSVLVWVSWVWFRGFVFGFGGGVCIVAGVFCCFGGGFWGVDFLWWFFVLVLLCGCGVVGGFLVWCGLCGWLSLLLFMALFSGGVCSVWVV